jgi:glycosyltransferase involved in cell wall biosynthesis
VPELVSRKRIQKIWAWIESLFLPHVHHAFTVSSSIADAYRQQYGVNMKVIRNMPLRITPDTQPTHILREAAEKIVLYQGALNLGRGLELAIRAIQHTLNTRLILIGRGDEENKLKELVNHLELGDRVTFLGRISPDRLAGFTMQADLGISLEEDLGLNYRFSLPNKVFDYIQAGVPVLVSDLPEVRALVERYGVGLVSQTNDPELLGALFTEMTTHEERRAAWKSNLRTAAEILCWEKEEGGLEELFRHALKQPFTLQGN